MKYLLLFLLGGALGLDEVSAQPAAPPLKKEYLDSTFTVLPSAVGARYQLETQYTDSIGGEVRDYYLSRKLQSRGTYENIRHDIAHGIFETWYESGQLETLTTRPVLPEPI